MRLIDADAFDERVRVAGGMSEDELTDDFKDGVQAVLYMLSNQPTITPEPHWIPVTERLPEKNGEYIVTIQCEHVDGWDDYVTGFAEWDVDDWHLVSYYPGQIKVVAYMPLPEPFKEVTE